MYIRHKVLQKKLNSVVKYMKTNVSQNFNGAEVKCDILQHTIQKKITIRQYKTECGTS